MEEIVKSRILGVLALLTLVFALTACNGSGGSDSSSSNGSSGGGSVAAAPLQSAKVFGLSTEGDKLLIGTTDSNGAFVANSNASKLQFPAVVWSVGGWNVNDDVTDASKEFKGTLKGVMTSATGKVYLTPANTLVAALYEKTGDLSEATSQVENLIKNEMGLKIENPLANPLSDLSESEIVSKTLMHIIGAGSESNGAAMELLSKKITDIAKEMNEGKSFTEVVKTLPASPFYNAPTTLAECVKDEGTIIAEEAKASLGNLVTLEELKANTETKDTSAFAIALNVVVDGNKNNYTEKVAAEAGDIETRDFAAKVTMADGTEKTASTDFKLTLINGTIAGKVSGKTYTLAPTDKLIFSVELPSDVTFPYSASFTLETVDVEPTFSRTYIMTFITKDEFAVKSVDYKGKDLLSFNTNTVDGNIAEGATSSITPATFTANVELVNDIEEALAAGNMDVRFVAPAGFVFSSTEGNEDTVTASSFSKAGKVYTAEHSAVELAATAEMAAGFKTVNIQVLDKSGKQIANTSKDIVFVPEDNKNDITDATLEPKTLTITAPEDGKYAPEKISLSGSYKTWVKEADPSNKADGITKLPDNAEVILMSKTGGKVFKKDGLEVDRIVIAVKPEANFTFTSEVTNFDYIYNDANDDIKMVLMLDPENDTNNNIESPTLLKLRFEPK